jgi:hypothetical protein
LSQIKIEDTPPRESTFSDTTKKIIADVMNDPILEKQKQVKSSVRYEDLYKQQISERLKYSELLSVKRELVLPVHFKILLELQGYLDT